MLPRRHVPGESSPRFLRRKVLVSPDVTGLTSKDSMNLSQSAEELHNSCDEQQSELQVENSEQSESMLLRILALKEKPFGQLVNFHSS